MKTQDKQSKKLKLGHLDRFISDPFECFGERSFAAICVLPAPPIYT